MKSFFKILIMLLLTVNASKGQNLENVLEKILDLQLIGKDQASEFSEIFKQYQSISISAYLYTLYQIEFKNVTGTYPGFIASISYENGNIESNEQIKINEELSEYLLKLYDCDLINEKQFDELQMSIENNEFVHLLQLISSAVKCVELDEYMNPDKLKRFAEKLKNEAIVTEEYGGLISGIEKGTLNRSIDFLNYCGNSIIINTQEYSDKPEEYLEQIHQVTANLIPEMSFTDFEFRVVLDSSMSDTSHEFYNFVVTLMSNGKKYVQKSFYRLYSPSKDQYSGKKIDQQAYYKIFNKILADVGSSYRLHEVKAYHGNTVDWKTFGIIALTEEQAIFLHGGEVFFTPSYENFNGNMTSDKIDNAFEEYKKLGLFDHLTTKQIDASMENVYAKNITISNDILSTFPNVILSFDVELDNLEDPYVEIIKGYSKISHLDFNPTNVKSNFDLHDDKVLLSFGFNGKIYEKEFEVDGDWIDARFGEFVNEVILKNELIK